MNTDYPAILAKDAELASETYLKTLVLDYRQMKHFVEDPLIVTEGDGVRFKDINGKWYLDALAGVYVVNVGHGNKRVLEALKAQLDRFVFAPPLHGVNPTGIRLANLLSAIAPGNLRRVKLLTGGSEVNETAMKMAKQYHQVKGNHRKYKILSFYNSYHGATMGAMSATGKFSYKKYYQPLLEGFVHVHSHYCYRCPFDREYPGCDILCAKVIERTIEKEDPESIAGMILEPIINIQGIVTPPQEYLPMIREICTRHNIILIYDEIITGFGRTGNLFAANTFNAAPDILCCGKGMSSGYAPLAACLIDENIADTFYGDEPGIEFAHGHTHSFHVLPAAAGLAATRELLERDLAGNARRLEGYVKNKLKELDDRFGIIGDIRGKGLMIGAELVRDKGTREHFPDEIALGKQISKACLKNGLLLRAEAHWFSIAPPLIVTEKELDEMFGILEKSIDQVLKSIS
jgi:adenosylmethionine-8-amino-7-oxononanoate aminotransferase